MVAVSVENDRFIDELVSSGRFANRQAALDEAINILRRELRENIERENGELSPQEWCEDFEAWAASHRTLPCEADDSRESIYAGRD